MRTVGKNVIHRARWFALTAAALVAVTACGSDSKKATTTSVPATSSTPATATTTPAAGDSTTVPARTTAPSAATTANGHTAEPGKPGVAYSVTVSDVSPTPLRPGQRYSAITSKPGAYFDTVTGEVVGISDDVLTDNGKATLSILPTVLGDTVVFARQPVSTNGFGGKPDLEVVAADIGSGKVRWTHPQPADTVSLSVGNGTTGDAYVYGHSNDDRATFTDLHAIVVSTGAEIDLTDICGPPTKNLTGATWGASSIVATDGDFVVECELILDDGVQDRIARRVKPDGTEVWSANTLGGGGIGPHVGDNVGSLRFVDGTMTNVNCGGDVCLDEYVLIDLPNQQSFARYRLDEVPAYVPLGSLDPPDDAILRDPTGEPMPAVSRLDGARVIGRSKAGLFVIDVATGTEEPLTLDGDLAQVLDGAVLVRTGDKLERVNL